MTRNSLTLGYAGVCSNFALHAQKASKQFGVDARDILIELGNRKVAGGQEDMIIDVAAEITKKQKQYNKRLKGRTKMTLSPFILKNRR